MNDLHHRFRFEALPTRGTTRFVMQQRAGSPGVGRLLRHKLAGF